MKSAVRTVKQPQDAIMKTWPASLPREGEFYIKVYTAPSQA
jgi:hypothetical protein